MRLLFKILSDLRLLASLVWDSLFFDFVQYLHTQVHLVASMFASICRCDHTRVVILQIRCYPQIPIPIAITVGHS